MFDTKLIYDLEYTMAGHEKVLVGELEFRSEFR